MGRIKVNKAKSTRAAATAAALAITAAAMTGGGGTEAVKAEPPANVDMSCAMGGIMPMTVPAWACPSSTGGHFYGWWLTPSATPPPAGYPVQADKINPDGSVGTSADPTTRMDETLMYILAVGSRGQGAFIDPTQWIPDGAKAQVDLAVNGGTGATAVSWVKQQIAGACPTDVSIANGARIGYTLWSVNEAPETITPVCDVRAKVRESFNPATGQYGATLGDTVWSVIALSSWGESASFSSATTSYLLSQRNANGGWGSGPDGYDYALTSRTLMAMLQLGVAPSDPVFTTAMQLFGSTQNEDGGWGKTADKTPRSETVATALVHGIVQRLYFLGEPVWDPAVFRYGSDGAGGVGGRMGVQYPLQVLTQNAGTGDAEEGKFYKFVGPMGGAKNQAEAVADADTRPTTSTMFYTYFSDPVRGAGTPITPTVDPVNPPNDEGSITAAIIPTAVTAVPTVTG